MADDVITPARKRQFIIGGLLMLMVIVLAAVVAANGQQIYMAAQGYHRSCNRVGTEMICQYCKCEDNGGYCVGAVERQCVSE